LSFSPFSLCTFQPTKHSFSWLSSGLPYHFTDLGFPEFTHFLHQLLPIESTILIEPRSRKFSMTITTCLFYSILNTHSVNRQAFNEYFVSVTSVPFSFTRSVVLSVYKQFKLLRLRLNFDRLYLGSHCWCLCAHCSELQCELSTEN